MKKYLILYTYEGIIEINSKTISPRITRLWINRIPKDITVYNTNVIFPIYDWIWILK